MARSREDVDAGMRAENSFDVEAAITQFLADPALASLALPRMTTGQQKQVTMVVDLCPRVRCGTHGFGAEQRLCLSKVENNGDIYREDDAELSFKGMPQHCFLGGKGKRDTGVPDLLSLSTSSFSTIASGASTSGVASMRGMSHGSSSSKSTDEEAMSEPPELIQVHGTYVHIDGVGPVEQHVLSSAKRSPDDQQLNNTFIHVEDVGPVDNRNIRSMPLIPNCANTMGDASTRIPLAPVEAAAGVSVSTCIASAPVEANVSVVAAAADEHRMPATPPIMTPLASPPQCWAPGTEVVIEGLAKFPAFNGCRGVVRTLDLASGRYDIHLALPVAGHQRAKVKAENIRMVVSPLLPSYTPQLYAYNAIF